MRILFYSRIESNERLIMLWMPNLIDFNWSLVTIPAHKISNRIGRDDRI